MFCNKGTYIVATKYFFSQCSQGEEENERHEMLFVLRLLYFSKVR